MPNVKATSDTVLLSGSYTTSDLSQTSVTFEVFGTPETIGSQSGGAGAGKAQVIGFLTEPLNVKGHTASADFAFTANDPLTAPYTNFSVIAIPTNSAGDLFPTPGTVVNPGGTATAAGTDGSVTLSEQALTTKVHYSNSGGNNQATNTFSVILPTS